MARPEGFGGCAVILPGQLWPGVVAPYSFKSLGHIEQIVCKQMNDAKFGLWYSNTWNNLCVKKRAQAHLKILSTEWVHKSNMHLTYMFKDDLALDNLQLLICHKTRPNQIIYIYIYHHHHIVLAARISLTFSRHSSLSFIALGRCSGQQPVSSHSCWMYVRAGRPAFARPCVGIHKSRTYKRH